MPGGRECSPARYPFCAFVGLVHTAGAGRDLKPSAHGPPSVS